MQQRGSIFGAVSGFILKAPEWQVWVAGMGLITVPHVLLYLPLHWVRSEVLWRQDFSTLLFWIGCRVVAGLFWSIHIMLGVSSARENLLKGEVGRASRNCVVFGGYCIAGLLLGHVWTANILHFSGDRTPDSARPDLEIMVCFATDVCLWAALALFSTSFFVKHIADWASLLEDMGSTPKN